MLTFDEIRIKSQKPENRFIGKILALDPGETTGYCVMNAEAEKVSIIEADQVKTWPLETGVGALDHLLTIHQPDMIVFESYQVYEWKSQDHTWSQIPTVQVIGCVKTLCIQRALNYHTQTAQVAKQFCTDQKLEEWKMWLAGKRHARDAIRHACYYLLFRPLKSS